MISRNAVNSKWKGSIAERYPAVVEAILKPSYVESGGVMMSFVVLKVGYSVSFRFLGGELSNFAHFRTSYFLSYFVYKLFPSTTRSKQSSKLPQNDLFMVWFLQRAADNDGTFSSQQQQIVVSGFRLFSDTDGLKI